MPSSPSGEVTDLLLQWSDGDRGALRRLISVVYGELHRQAEIHMRRERRDHTLEPTDLIHEAYLQLAGQNRAHWRNRSQFFAVTARLMHQIALNHARRYRTAKRGGGAARIPLDESMAIAEQRATELLALDEKLSELAHVDPRQGRLVLLRFFGGLTLRETARALGISIATVKREWRLARAWLQSELGAEAS